MLIIFLDVLRVCERQRDIDRRNDRSEEDDEEENPQGKWPHALSSALACLGCTLGLFNISRFAILSIQFGGKCMRTWGRAQQDHENLHQSLLIFFLHYRDLLSFSKYIIYKRKSHSLVFREHQECKMHFIRMRSKLSALL